MNKIGRYNALISEIFRRNYTPNSVYFEFTRAQLIEVSNELQISLPKNIGDVLYSFRFRRPLPKEITDTAPPGQEWIIELAGTGNYNFRLDQINRIFPNLNLIQIKIPDSTPEIVLKYTSGDEQALLTKIRYNRLIDIFLGITAYSLQNHLRTTVTGIGQIEIDEVYVGVNRHGAHFIIPVQAKGGSDQLSVVQAKQDIGYCTEIFPELICRAISAQFMANDVIAMFELTLDEGAVKVVEEKHYKLVLAAEISNEDLENYRKVGR